MSGPIELTELVKRAAKIDRTLSKILRELEAARSAGETNDAARHALTIPEFCRRYSISRSSFYNMLRDGESPKTMRVRHRVLISRESADEWAKGRENA